MSEMLTGHTYCAVKEFCLSEESCSHEDTSANLAVFKKSNNYHLETWNFIKYIFWFHMFYKTGRKVGSKKNLKKMENKPKVAFFNFLRESVNKLTVPVLASVERGTAQFVAVPGFC